MNLFTGFYLSNWCAMLRAVFMAKCKLAQKCVATFAFIKNARVYSIFTRNYMYKAVVNSIDHQHNLLVV